MRPSELSRCKKCKRKCSFIVPCDQKSYECVTISLRCIIISTNKTLLSSQPEKTHPNLKVLGNVEEPKALICFCMRQLRNGPNKAPFRYEMINGVDTVVRLGHCNV